MEFPPPRVFRNNDKDTFGQYTATVRWPIILQNCIDDMNKRLSMDKNNDISDNSYSLSEKDKKIGSEIVNKIEQFRSAILDKPAETEIALFGEKELATEPDLKYFNDHLNKHNTVSEENAKGTKMTWENGDWLFTEIYLYRNIHTFFSNSGSEYWQKFDIFNYLKQSTFESSYHGVQELAKFYIDTVLPVLQKKDVATADLKKLYLEFINISLWGNATDLSLLTNATMEDIKKIQGSESRKSNSDKVLVDHSERSWNYMHVNSYKNLDSKVDIICDNSGFEVYTDLIMALFLIEGQLTAKVELHLKNVPYMVSDVMQKDIVTLLKDLKSPTFFAKHSQQKVADPYLLKISQILEEKMNSGLIFFNNSPYWTSCDDYWTMSETSDNKDGQEMFKYLNETSLLIIFKGDLNYRKLTGDRTWDRTTPWRNAIGPLGKNGLPMISLRTCKADVVAALPPGCDEKLSAEWAKDHEHGSWWCTSGKWAVVCFSF